MTSITNNGIDIPYEPIKLTPWNVTKTTLGLPMAFVYEGLSRLTINPNQVSVLGVGGSVVGAGMALESQDPIVKTYGLGIFMAARLMDLLDGKYARYLARLKRWQSKFDGASCDPLCDKAGIYLALALYLKKHTEGNVEDISMMTVASAMFALDVASTFMRETNWKNMINSVFTAENLTCTVIDEGVQEKPRAEVDNKANRLGKLKTTGQTIGTGVLLLGAQVPEGTVIALASFISATVLSVMSLAKKMKSKKTAQVTS